MDSPPSRQRLMVYCLSTRLLEDRSSGRQRNEYTDVPSAIFLRRSEQSSRRLYFRCRRNSDSQASGPSIEKPTEKEIRRIERLRVTPIRATASAIRAPPRGDAWEMNRGRTISFVTDSCSVCFRNALFLSRSEHPRLSSPLSVKTNVIILQTTIGTDA